MGREYCLIQTEGGQAPKGPSPFGAVGLGLVWSGTWPDWWDLVPEGDTDTDRTDTHVNLVPNSMELHPSAWLGRGVVEQKGASDPTCAVNKLESN